MNRDLLEHRISLLAEAARAIVPQPAAQRQRSREKMEVERRLRHRRTESAMATSTVVLAISRQLGSGGSYIGQGVAHRLGLKYIDREILQEAARLLDAEDLSSLE